MTVSTANRLVLHSVEVAHLYPQVVFPMLPGFAKPLNTSFGEWLGIHYETFPKKSLYVRTGPFFRDTSEDEASFTRSSKLNNPKIHQSNSPGTTYRSSSYLAKTRAI